LALIRWKQVSALKDGDICSETIMGSAKDDIIIKNGDKITHKSIQKLHQRGIDWISVYEEESFDTAVNDLFSEEKLEKFSTELSKVCEETLKDGRINVEKTQQISDEINQEIIEEYGEYVVPSLVKLKKMDDYTFTHQVNVAIISTILATEKYGKKKEVIEKFTMGGLLHDMGKLWIPEEILKSNNRLKDAEFDIIKKHPEYGFKIAELSGVQDTAILNAIRYHHERWDSKGYLQGLKEHDIPLEGRFLMVADVFDALTTKRPYKVEWEPYEAVSFIVKQSKKMFDPEIVRLFLLSFGLYPVNTKVILNTDELAIVVGNRRGSITRPIVKVIRDDQQIEIDLSQEDKISIKKVIKIRMLKD
jgi:HD-GYP domain-containing protein (c-di-GMP phosphodiesterase class II)